MSENGEIYTAGKNFILPPAVTASELHCARSFQGYPHLTIFGAVKYAPKYAYLGEPNMVKWGIPEKMLQNAVQNTSKNTSKLCLEVSVPKFLLPSNFSVNPACIFPTSVCSFLDPFCSTVAG